jgi:hypothetical protein
MSNITRTSLDALSQSNFPNNTTQQISPADLRGWIESAVDSFVTQKDTSTFENAFYECKSSTIIVAGIGSCNLVAATGNFVHITSSGSATITSFGNLPAGSRFILNFEVPITLQYNATTLILPGAADIITAAGDSVLIVSEGSGNWRLIGYFPAAGLPVGTVTAVTASAPLSSTGGNAPDISITQADSTTDGYLSSSDWNTFDGKQDALSAGTGISLAGNTVTNTAPDQTVALTAGTGINVTGTYPSFTIAATGGGGGTPGGADTEVQFNNAGAFDGIPDLTYSGGFVQIETPKIGTSVGNGHLHIHTINTSPPNGFTDYVTLYVDKSPKQIGARFETDAFTSAFQFGATANRVYTFPDDTGNVVLDTTSQTLSNKTLSTPTIDGIATFGNGASAGEIRLLEPSGSGTNYVAVKAQAMASDYSLTLPTTAGSSGQVLITDGSGGLSWTTNGGAITTQYLKNFTTGTVTGTTAATVAHSILISANTFTAGQAFRIENRTSRTAGATASTTVALYINTSIAVGGGTLIGQWSMGSGVAGGIMTRGIAITSATTSIYNSTSAIADYSVTGINTANIDWTINQYLIVAYTNPSTTTVTNSLATNIYPI